MSRLRNAIGRFMGWGWCYRCKATWNYTKEHITPYSVSGGCFPLCEKCWGELTPSERMPYYEMMMNKWMRDSPLLMDEYKEKWADIRRAVLAGK